MRSVQPKAALRLASMALGLLIGALLTAGACGGDGEAPTPSPTAQPSTIETEGNLVYVGGLAPSSDIYVIDVKDGQPVQLTDDGIFKQWPRWSPDGQRLAFVSWPGEQSLFSESAELIVMGADGSDRKTVATVLGREIYSPVIDWSPDGQTIALEAWIRSDDVTAGIDLLDVATEELIELAEGRVGSMPTWSPDGSSILFLSYDDPEESDLEIFVMEPDGANPRRLARNDGLDISPLWSPDGSRVLWWERKSGGSHEMFMADVEDPKPESLGSGSRPVWSPDGQHIAFLDLTDETNVDVFVLNVDSGERTNVSDDPGRDTWPAWSPDGARIAFVSSRDNPLGDIYLVNADGSNLTRLTDDEMSEGMLEWAHH